MSYSRMLFIDNEPFWMDNPLDSKTKCFFRVFSVAQKSSDFSSIEKISYQSFIFLEFR